MNPPVELLPCPFCGQIPNLHHKAELAWIGCRKNTICFESGIIHVFKSNNIDQGIKVWNTRNVKSFQEDRD